jgi:hypothetical protein
VSAAPTTPNAPMRKSGRSLSRIRHFIVCVRRAGVPHEETVIIPAVATDLLSAVAGSGRWQYWISTIALVVIIFICGAWLALAWWRGSPLVAVLRPLLRPLYSGVLATVLWMATHDNPNSKQDIVHWVSIIWLGQALFFIPGFVVATLIRDTILRSRGGYSAPPALPGPTPALPDEGDDDADPSHRVVYRKPRKLKQWGATFIQNSQSVQGLWALIQILLLIGGLIFVSMRYGLGSLVLLLPGAH